MIDWKHYVTELAEAEIETDAYIRAMILTFTGMNWVMLVQILLYMIGMKSETDAALSGMYHMAILLVGFAVITRLPAAARVIERRVIE